jgi:carbamoyl-phosphate synthase large subunit
VTSLKRVLVIGSGPIVIGQACEFDYSGTQACKALRREGLEVVLVNSNPATIMTDPELADRTYVEPLTPATVEAIIARERPDALLPTVGGQTALNLAVALAKSGALERHGVRLIGASLEAIEVAEDRLRFREAMRAVGVAVPESGLARTPEEALSLVALVGFPAIIRPSFTLGGVGGGIAYNQDEFRELVVRGLSMSPVHEVLVEQSVLGWKEYELEVMRDRADNFVVVCSIENIDPMGIHTGDSITVAPAQTLSDKEYQRLRDLARLVISTVGVETGGSNIQFAVNPANGDVVTIEMNPRVSRSSALASKATGFPIAKIAALLAVGHTLDEIRNDITRVTPASFEPSIDYVVVKVPRWNFDKFPEADRRLTTQMKSVGEAMAIGRTFKEAFLKGLRSLELRGAADLWLPDPADRRDPEQFARGLSAADERRIWRVFHALEDGWDVERLHEITRIDPWFLTQFAELVAMARGLREGGPSPSPGTVASARLAGFSGEEIARLSGVPAAAVEALGAGGGVRRVFKRIDTCAAEFESFTPYLYSTYAEECEADPTPRRKVVILGSGPNRIGQGIEFDYCCCHAAFALREEGIETVMVNCNPETVSTDYDTADRLYFEPLTFENVMGIVAREREAGGEVSCLVQFGGQTPLKLALPLHRAGVPIIGTSADSIDLAEDRKRFAALLDRLGIAQPASGTALSGDEARAVARAIGFPVLVRPSYVLGGRGMAIVYDEGSLDGYVARALADSPGSPVLIDRYLEDAFELDVDALADATGHVVIGGVMEHIEQAGIHSGDSSCVLPSYLVPERHLDTIRDWTRRIARALDVVGLMNIQFALKDDQVYVLEVNPRASRTVPFLSKATGVPLAKAAARLMLGRTLADLDLTGDVPVSGTFVKTPVFPFARFTGVDTLLGPEMKSTGEAMGCGTTFGAAFARAQEGAGSALPTSGTAFLSVNDNDKPVMLRVARGLAALGFSLAATRGTAAYLTAHGLPARPIYKVNEGRPNIADAVANGEIALVVNTPLGRASFFDEKTLRRSAMLHGVPCLTTISAAAAAVSAIAAIHEGEPEVRALQDYHRHE